MFREATDAEWAYLNELNAPLLEAGWVVRQHPCHHLADVTRTLEAALVRDGWGVHVQVHEEQEIEAFLRPLDWEYETPEGKGAPLIAAEGTD